MVQEMSRSCSNSRIFTVTSYLPSGKSLSDSRSMWMTNVSSTADAGSPSALCSMPVASMATCPSGSHNTAKTSDAGASMVRWTSIRSLMVTIVSGAMGRRGRFRERVGARPRQVPGRLLVAPACIVGYVTAMSNSGVLGQTAAGSADALQGGYFRAMLVAERGTAANDLLKARAELTRQANAAGALVLGRLHDEVLAKEAQLDHLDALIAALDERFAEHWADD